MNYYRIIDIEDLDLIQRKTRQFIFSEVTLGIGFSILQWDRYINMCPEILHQFNKYDLFPVKAGIYVTTETYQSKVHIDYVSEKYHQCRINIPILNCEGSKTEFYKGGTYKQTTQVNQLSFLQISDDLNSLEKMCEVEIIKPTVIRVQEPHRVVTNEERIPRICMTLFMDKDPVFFL